MCFLPLSVQMAYSVCSLPHFVTECFLLEPLELSETVLCVRRGALFIVVGPLCLGVSVLVVGWRLLPLRFRPPLTSASAHPSICPSYIHLSFCPFLHLSVLHLPLLSIHPPAHPTAACWPPELGSQEWGQHRLSS